MEVRKIYEATYTTFIQVSAAVIAGFGEAAVHGRVWLKSTALFIYVLSSKVQSNILRGNLK